LIVPPTKKHIDDAKDPSDYLSNIDEWPEDWMGVEEDLAIGRGLLGLFIPFIQHLIDEGLAAKTIKNHGYHLNMLGGEIIERLNQDDEDNRKLSPRELVIHYAMRKAVHCSRFWTPTSKPS
jgi:hypothetical protein